MARNINGGTDYVYWDIPPAPDAVGTLAFWIKTSSTPASTAALVTYWSTTSRRGLGVIQGTSNVIAARGYDTTTQRVGITSTTTIATGNWLHIAFNFNRNNGGANELFINAASEGTANSSADWNDSGTDFYVECGDNVDTLWATPVADFAEIGMWWGAQLTAAQITGLSKGLSPIAAGGNLVFYSSLSSNLHSPVLGPHQSNSGGSYSAHPRIYGPMA